MRLDVVVVFVLVGCLVGGGAVASSGAGVDSAATAERPEQPRIVELYPNPVPHGDPGEYVIVEFPTETALDDWRLADRYDEVALPNVTVDGRVAFSPEPSVAANVTDAPVYEISGALALADRADTIRLLHGDRVVDECSYERAPEAERWIRTADGWSWEPVGATDRPVSESGPQTVTAFVLPDSPETPERVLRSADDRLLVAAYTLTSNETTRELRRAAERGVDVRVLVEGGPVGGISERQADRLDELVEAGVEVSVVSGSYARYRFHHAKYAVADDRAIVLTENWKPAGTGGQSNRGWGVVVSGEPAAELATTFEADSGWRDGIDWRTFRENRTFEEPSPATGSYPGRIEPTDVRAESVSVLHAPENAESGIVAELDDAEESIRIKQLSIDPEHPFVDATIEAAERGVEVQLLVSGEWYVHDENAAAVEQLNERAEREGLPIEARLAEPRSRYGSIHAKGIVIDDRTAIVGSVNWSNTSIRENREIVLVLEGDDVAEYYGAAFRDDWQGGIWALPIGLIAAVGATVGGAVVVLSRRIRIAP